MREIFDSSNVKILISRSNAAGSGLFSPLSAGQAGFGGIPIAIGPEGKGVGVNMFNQKKKGGE